MYHAMIVVTYLPLRMRYSETLIREMRVWRWEKNMDFWVNSSWDITKQTLNICFFIVRLSLYLFFGSRINHFASYWGIAFLPWSTSRCDKIVIKILETIGIMFVTLTTKSEAFDFYGHNDVVFGSPLLAGIFEIFTFKDFFSPNRSLKNIILFSHWILRIGPVYLVLWYDDHYNETVFNSKKTIIFTMRFVLQLVLP